MTDDARYRALAARDPRFDGVFFVGVRTTGIYCRPICPARTPGRARCEFFANARTAEAAGFRACFRCRPELAPRDANAATVGVGTVAAVDAVAALAERAARRIAEGALDELGLDRLAAELGASARHLRRACEAKLGVSPRELAQRTRLAVATQLVRDTALPITAIAHASGYRSLRRFNAAFRDRVGCAPSRLRAVPRRERARDRIALRLDYRAPYDWDRVIGFLAPRAVAGVEHITAARYRRIVALGDAIGAIEVTPLRDRDALELVLAPELVAVAPAVIARVRRLFDLDARPDAIAAVLGTDPLLAPHVAARPGLRVPGAIDPFEAAVRALLGQQVSVAAATTLAGRFARAFGSPIHDARDGDPLAVRFPTPREVARASIDRIAKVGLPGARAAAIRALAAAIVAGEIAFDGTHELDAFVERLDALPGIGPWTAHYLAMRGLHVPDAFPAEDLGVQKALGHIGGRAAIARADAWRPFRAYAVLHLWTALSEGGLS